MSYDMGYYGGGYGFDADPYEEQEEQEEQPQPRKSGGQGLRSYAQRVDRENQDLKRRLAELEDANRDLLGGSPHSPGNAPQNGGPQPERRPILATPFASDAEQMQYHHMLSQGNMSAHPAGSEAEQIARIRNARNAEELTEYLRSQGSQIGQSYDGMGF
ncbi:hypothetical protein WJM95_07675 [Streptomyces sp. f51]|uniref:hypothetical protein n=1 Tax=Streptomyces sp. f51 TaxID=1827742 RepID=UPI0030CD43F5